MTAPVAIVTGASSGIGRATALRLAASGHHLTLVARGDEGLESAAFACRARGAASVDVYSADVGDDSAVAGLFDDVVARHGTIETVVHSAGVVAYGRMEEIPADVFEGVLQINLVGSINIARHAVTLFRAQNKGNLVLVGSLIGHITVPSMTPYVLSKWAVRALARQLEVENRDQPKVRISYVAPGGINTPIYAQAANYAGYAGRPPPPVASAESVARAIERRVAGRWRQREQLSIANDVIRFGHTFVPFAYDRLVGPLFRLAARDLTKPTDATAGNVLKPGARHTTDDAAIPSSATALVRNISASIKRSRAPAAIVDPQ